MHQEKNAGSCIDKSRCVDGSVTELLHVAVERVVGCEGEGPFLSVVVPVKRRGANASAGATGR